MTGKAPGNYFRTGMTPIEAVREFGDDEKAEQMFIETRWPDGVRCPFCETDKVQVRESRKPAPFRCPDCRKYFSVKTNTIMHGSNIPLSKWALAIYLITTDVKGVSSLKLHRDIGVTQRTAWYLNHRIRAGWEEDQLENFEGPVEVDETYIGGRRGNRRNRPDEYGRGAVGKTPVVGIRDRETGRIVAQPMEHLAKWRIQPWIERNTTEDARIYSDASELYPGVHREHQSVLHKHKEYKKVLENGDEVYTNGIESFWALLKRGYHGTYHHWSKKHLHRYVTEFAGRNNDRPLDTIDRVRAVVRGLDGKRLPYKELTGNA